MTETTSAPIPAEPAPAAAPPVVKVVCANCGAELLGEYCYSCGQPVKGMIRPLSSMMHDIADTIFNIDSRIFRTLWPLYVKPGYLSNEYFSGRRVRFVTPFRLYFFLSIAAFFAIQVWLGDVSLSGINVQGPNSASFSGAMTKEEVAARRDAKIADMEIARGAITANVKPDKAKKAAEKLDREENKIRDEADKRMAYLDKVAEAKTSNKPPPPESDGEVDEDHESFNVNGKKWDEKNNPVHFDWLPAFANARFNAAIGRALINAKRASADPRPFIIGIFSVLPQVLFVVMPLFALILKIFFIFKRRLYMEHLIIALHSHAFIFLSLLLITLMIALKTSVAASAPWLAVLLDWLIFFAGWWIPIYLFLMQKRVYKQGWIMTTIKFGVIGICYVVIISIGAALAAVVSIATT
jgi:chorismate mutase